MTALDNIYFSPKLISNIRNNKHVFILGTLDPLQPSRSTGSSWWILWAKRLPSNKSRAPKASATCPLSRWAAVSKSEWTSATMSIRWSTSPVVVCRRDSSRSVCKNFAVTFLMQFFYTNFYKSSFSFRYARTYCIQCFALFCRNVSRPIPMWYSRQDASLFNDITPAHSSVEITRATDR